MRQNILCCFLLASAISIHSSCNQSKPEDIEQEWIDYCDKFVPEELRQQMKEMETP